MSASRSIFLYAALLTVLSSLALPARAQATVGGAHPRLASSPSGGPARTATAMAASAAVIGERWIDSRTLDLTIDSPSLGALHPNKVRLLLPPGYSKTAGRTWPVLFLLHGGLSDYRAWSDTGLGNARAVIGDTDVITVLPGSGCSGGYVNWWNYGKHGRPAWETYHLNELLPLLTGGYRAGEQKAIAGLSMGGFGALNYATRHPDLFRAAASYSGAVHTLLDPQRSKEIAIQGSALCALQVQPSDWRAAMGDPTVAAERPLWEKYNPYDNVAGLTSAHQAYVSSGDGQCGELDKPICLGLPPDPVEPLFNAESRAFADAAAARGVKVTRHFYKGRHDWPYWHREFRTSFPLLMNAIGATPAR